MFSEGEFLRLGNSFLHDNVQRKSLEQRRYSFKNQYGLSSTILANIWSRLRSSDDPEIAIDKYCSPVYLLLYWRWCKGYESERELHDRFGYSENTIRQWTETLATKVANLRRVLVSDIIQIDSAYPSVSNPD